MHRNFSIPEVRRGVAFADAEHFLESAVWLDLLWFDDWATDCHALRVM